MTYTEYKKIYVKIDKKLFLTMKFLGIVDSGNFDNFVNDAIEASVLKNHDNK